MALGPKDVFEAKSQRLFEKFTEKERQLAAKIEDQIRGMLRDRFIDGNESLSDHSEASVNLGKVYPSPNVRQHIQCKYLTAGWSKVTFYLPEGRLGCRVVLDR